MSPSTLLRGEIDDADAAFTLGLGRLDGGQRRGWAT